MANSVDPDEMARYEPSHQDLRCLHIYLYQSTGLKRLILVNKKNTSNFCQKENSTDSILNIPD